MQISRYHIFIHRLLSSVSMSVGHALDPTSEEGPSSSRANVECMKKLPTSIEGDNWERRILQLRESPLTSPSIQSGRLSTALGVSVCSTKLIDRLSKPTHELSNLPIRPSLIHALQEEKAPGVAGSDKSSEFDHDTGRRTACHQTLQGST